MLHNSPVDDPDGNQGGEEICDPVKSSEQERRVVIHSN